MCLYATSIFNVFLFKYRKSVTYLGRVDDATPCTEPKPLTANFYIDQAVSVQESVGGGVQIDVDDITKVVVDDECDIDASRIDNAQVALEKDKSTLSNAKSENKVEDNVASRIDEAKIILDDKSAIDTSETPKKSQSDGSRIDQAEVNLDALESQIETASSSAEVITPVVSNVDANESRIDVAEVSTAKEEECSLSKVSTNDASSPNLSGIDQACVVDNEKGSAKVKEPLDVSHSEQDLSRIDDANIKEKNIKNNTNAETTALQSPSGIDDSCRLDMASDMTTSQENENMDTSADVKLDLSQSSSSRIDSVTPGNIVHDENVPSSQEHVDLCDSRIDNIKLPSNEASITITSPSPSKDTYTLTPEKFVKKDSYIIAMLFN